MESNETNKVLFVDDESLILFSLKRLFRQNNIKIDVESDCFKAMQMIRENNYKVIVSDFKMPSMNGSNFLEIAKEVSPQSIRLILSAHVTQESLTEIINKSEIYRFVNKPWSDSDLISIIVDSINKYDRNNPSVQNEPLPIETLKEEVQEEEIKIIEDLPIDNYFNDILPTDNIDKKDLKKYSELLRTEQHQHLNYIINLTSQKIGQHCKNVAQLSVYIGKKMKLSEASLTNLYYAGLYHDIGKLFELVAQADHCEIGFNLLSQYQELKEAAIIVKNHHKKLNSSDANSIPIESKILSIVDYFDKEITRDKKSDEKDKTLAEILGNMKTLCGESFDNDIFDIFQETILKDFRMDMFFNERKIHITEIEEGMVFSRPVFNIEGKMLINSEYKLTKDVIKRLFKHHDHIEVKSPLYVYVKVPEKAFNFDEFISKKIK